MLEVRRSAERGHANHGWLDSYHSFSFASYYDPKHMQFGHLRVINEDRVEPGEGFGTHPHNDMEIITYVLDGKLQHRDSMGHEAIIKAGEVQRISAGTGIAHSEYNASDSDPVHFLQIWVMPWARGLAPSYDQQPFAVEEGAGWQLIASGDNDTAAIAVNQNMQLSAARLAQDEQLSCEVAAGRQAYIHLVRGSLQIGETTLQSGDALKVTQQQTLQLVADKASEVLWFDLQAM